ncbi:MAG: hypothetical protein ACYCXP_09080 [Leptospirillum sp.]|jgi:hypothetical protein|nr:hypothetical protein [Nitrospiraceae bacterium]
MSEMKKALDRVSDAMDEFMFLLDAQIRNLEKSGTSPDDLRAKMVSFVAIRDSGKMYLDWADYYSKKIFGDSENLEGEPDVMQEEDLA